MNNEAMCVCVFFICFVLHSIVVSNILIWNGRKPLVYNYHWLLLYFAKKKNHMIEQFAFIGTCNYLLTYNNLQTTAHDHLLLDILTK